MTATAKEARTSCRAESLAKRIEEGAANLAALVEGLSEAQWRTPVSPNDRRSIGVIVHHGRRLSGGDSTRLACR